MEVRNYLSHFKQNSSIEIVIWWWYHLKKLHKVINFGNSGLNLAILGTKMMLKWIFLKNPANPHDEIFMVD